jgi:hypothetical protein
MGLITPQNTHMQCNVSRAHSQLLCRERRVLGGN